MPAVRPKGWFSPAPRLGAWNTLGVAVGPYELTVRELVAVRAVDRIGTPHLLLRDGAGALVLHALDQSPVRIGRAPESDLVVDWDPEVSRAHARFEDVVVGGASSTTG